MRETLKFEVEDMLSEVPDDSDITGWGNKRDYLNKVIAKIKAYGLGKRENPELRTFCFMMSKKEAHLKFEYELISE